MSLQEAASSGSFGPRAAQPPQTPAANQSLDQAVADPASPFAQPFAVAQTAAADGVEPQQPDMRARRRRAWAMAALAIVVPAAIAVLIAWQLFGSDSTAAPTITRVTTPTSEPAAQQVEAAAAAPVTSSVTITTGAAADATNETSVTVAAATEATASSSDSEASASSAAAIDLSGLEPVEQLAAWTDLETIEVLPGETLWLIAQNYETTISAIATLNGLTQPEQLSIGQQLIIPVGFAEEIAIADTTAIESSESTPSSTVSDTSPADTTVNSADTTDAVAVTSPLLPDDLANWHTIAPVAIETGDSLFAIANANDTTIEAIMLLNGLSDPHLIFVGQEVLVPVGYQGDAAITYIPEPQLSDQPSDHDHPHAPTTDDSGLMTEEPAADSGEEDDLLEG